MKNDELNELMSKSRQDGAQLYAVANAIYKVSVFFIIAIGIVGALLFLVAFSTVGLGAALSVAIGTTAICGLLYALAVLGSNGAKVIVHLLFSNIAILQKMKD